MVELLKRIFAVTKSSLLIKTNLTRVSETFSNFLGKFFARFPEHMSVSMPTEFRQVYEAIQVKVICQSTRQGGKCSKNMAA